MPYYRQRRGRRPYYSRKPRRAKRKTKSGKSSSTFKKKVLKVLHKASETKQMEPLFTFSNRVLPLLSDNTLQCISLTPVLSQGAGQGQRIGNQVSTMKAMVNLNIEATAITSSSGYVPPIYFDIYIYKWKRSNRVSSIDLNQFLQYGNTSIAYDSTTLPPCGNLKVNADSFTPKYHKRILLWNQTVSQQSQASGGALTNCSNVLNAKNINIDITKYLAKNMKFNDTVSNTPDDNLFLSVVATPNDQNTSYPNTQIFGTFDVMLQYQYDDI